MVALVGSQSPYVLDKDADVGFRESLANNQLNLALHYLVVRLEEMDAEIEKLRGSSTDTMPVSDPETKPLDESPPVAKATTKKATKKATRKKKVEAEEIPGATPVSEPKADEDE